MANESTLLARRILDGQPLAALGTLHAGEPSVSMVPFAIASGALVIHVSRLAAHTADLLAHPRVSLLVVDASGEAAMPQAVARISVDGDAERLDPGSPDAVAARAAYLERFPEAEQLFAFADFSLYAIHPRRARLVGGFAQATTLTGEELAAVFA